MAKRVFGDALKSKVLEAHVFGGSKFSFPDIGKVVFYEKKNYKGAKCTKRYVEKCEDVCKTYDAIQYAYADLLSKVEGVFVEIL